MTHSNLIIWHNPRCSKSRQTLALIEDAGRSVDIRRYLEDAPSAEEIRAVISKLRLSSARDLMRKGEAIYKELDLKHVSDEAALIAAMADHPKLIERPVVIDGDRAVLGRPPESVNKLL